MRNQNHASRVLWISTLAMIIGFTTWAALSPLAAQLQKLYGLNTTEKSILVAIPVLLGSVMRIPLGILTDRFGGRRVYSSLMLFLIIPEIGLGYAHSYIAFVAWAFLLGMAGTTFAIGITSVTKWFPAEKQGLILGVTGMGNIGTAVAGFLLPSLAKNYGISWSFWSLVPLLVLSALVILLFTKDPVGPISVNTMPEQFAALKHKRVWLLSLFYFVTFGAFVSFSIYLPSLLVDVFKITPVDAGGRAAGFVIVATIARPIGGWLADKYGAHRVLSVVFLLLSCSALTLAVVLEDLFIMTFACLLVGVVVGVGNGAVFKMVPEYFPKITGIVTGIVGAAGGIGGFFPPILMGVVKDATGDYVLGFLLLFLFTFVCYLINRKAGRGKENGPYDFNHPVHRDRDQNQPM